MDPLVRITQMKFMTSGEIRIAHGVKFACLDIRLKKVPRLTEIFKRHPPSKAQQQRPVADPVPVMELEIQPG